MTLRQVKFDATSALRPWYLNCQAWQRQAGDAPGSGLAGWLVAVTGRP